MTQLNELMIAERQRDLIRAAQRDSVSRELRRASPSRWRIAWGWPWSPRSGRASTADQVVTRASSTQRTSSPAKRSA
jgi:hypothetical protein